jgi:hypothetical protein
VPQEWHDGDHYSNVGPDTAVACWWVGYCWGRGETTVDDTVIDAVDTGYNGSDYLGWHDESSECPITWHVSDDRKHVSYTINWQPSANAPPFSPWYVSPNSVQAYIKIRPVAVDAFVWDGYVPGYLYSPDGMPAAWVGSGPIDPPVEMTAGCFFGYYYNEWWPNALGETSVYLDNPWL